MIRDRASLWILDRICSVTWAVRNAPRPIWVAWYHLSSPVYERLRHYMFVDEVRTEAEAK